ncbi:MAG: OmpA family protein [Flavobacteriales bacterium]|nr:OmpA family protein [Flavobacteriales bacterium]
MNKSLFQSTLLVLGVLLLASCAKISIKDGLQAYDELRYTDAIDHLERGLAKVDDEEGRRALAASYLETNQFASAVETYVILASNPSNTDEDRINYGRALMATGDYANAEEIFDGILSREPGNEVAQALRSSCRRIEEYKADSSRFDIKPLSTGMDAAYAPFAFGSGIYFSAEKEGTGEEDKYTGLKFTDLYFADVSNGTIGNPQPVEEVNDKYHDGIAVVSDDQQTMILTRSNYERKSRLSANAEEINVTQLYISSKDGEGKWSEPQLLPFCDENYMYAHPALSADGKTLYFSSDLQGGFGGMDLYKTTMNDQGVWEKPINLGSELNTPGNELFPSLRSDDSLYFSSNAHETLGGLDMMYSVHQGGNWNGPFHLPYPMNTAADDFAISFIDGSDLGYFSSDRSGNDQIYSFEETEQIFTLDGLVTSQTSGNPIEGAKIIITNLTDGTEEIIYSDDVGMFELDLLPGKDYRIRAEKEGYFSINEEVSTKNKPNGDNIDVNLALLELSNPDGTAGNGDGNGDGNGYPKGMNPNKPYEIPNIHWDYNKWDIRLDAQPYLDYVAKLLKDNPDLKVEIGSHCDSRGSDYFNEQLSERRAKAVSEYLVRKGVRRSMLISRGYGETRLLNNCSDGVDCTEDQHQDNRRTEFTVMNQ